MREYLNDQWSRLPLTLWSISKKEKMSSLQKTRSVCSWTTSQGLSALRDVKPRWAQSESLIDQIPWFDWIYAYYQMSCVQPTISISIYRGHDPSYLTIHQWPWINRRERSSPVYIDSGSILPSRRIDQSGICMDIYFSRPIGCRCCCLRRRTETLINKSIFAIDYEINNHADVRPNFRHHPACPIILLLVRSVDHQTDHPIDLLYRLTPVGLPIADWYPKVVEMGLKATDWLGQN